MSKVTDFDCKCSQNPKHDSMDGAVIGDGVFLDIKLVDKSADIKLSPDDARALAEWLEQAADEADAYES